MARPVVKLSDIRLVEWTDRKSFYRARSDWLRQSRHDRELSDRAKVMLAEIGDRLSWDKSSAWPSGVTLAAALGCGTATVTRSIEDAVSRGWLCRERGGFSKSNHYAMSLSESVAEAASSQHDERMRLRIPAAPFRSEVINMESDPELPISITSEAPFRSEVIDHVDHFRSISSISSDQLSSTVIQTSDPENLSKTDGLGDTEQEEAQGHPLLPSKSQTPVLLDDDEADEQLRVEEETLARLGEGDLSLGIQRAALIGAPRVSRLAARIGEVGMIEAADEIIAAIKSAREIEAKATAKDKAVTT